MSCERKHTPGPWFQFDDGGETPNGHKYGDHYANKVWGPKGPGFGCICDCRGYGNGKAEDIANAKLIAMAPSLLEALKCIVNALPTKRDWLDPDDEKYAKQVIAKALGA